MLSGGVEPFLGALEQHLARAPVARTDHAADADRRRHRARLGLERLRGDAVDETRGDGLQLLGVAFGGHDRNLVAGMPGEKVGSAHIRAKTARQRGDDLVPGVVAVVAI